MNADKWNGDLKAFLGLVLGFILGAGVFTVEKIELALGSFAEWFTALSTAALILAAYIQFTRQTFNQRQWATLQACDRYDSDPLLAEAVLLLRRSAIKTPSSIDHHSITSALTRIFNFFDAIAIGLHQGLYVEDIARSHLGNIIARRIGELDRGQHHAFDEFRKNFGNSFPDLVATVNRWELRSYSWIETR